MLIPRKYSAEEKKILDDFYYRSSSILINWMLLAFLLYASFGFVDYYLLPKNFEMVLLTRLVIVLPLLLALLLLAKFSRSRDFIKKILYFYVLVGAAGTLIFISFADPSEDAFKLYFVGLMLMSLWSQLITFPSYLSTIIAVAIYLLYNLVAIFVMNMFVLDFGIFLSSNLFYFSGLIMGSYSSNVLSEFIIKDKIKAIQYERFNQNLTKLVSILSHDIRGPLVNIAHLLSMYDDGLITQKVITEYNIKLGRSVKSVESVLSSILEWGSIVLKKDSFRFHNICIRESVDQVFLQFEETVKSKNNKLENLIDGQILIENDRSIISFIFRNLISNALKFTSNGIVSVSVKKVSDQFIEIVVTDTGQGMDETQVQDLNSKGFVQSTLGTEDEKGVGLGIWMIFDFLKLMGGELHVQSIKGIGSSFTLRLPRKIAKEKIEEFYF